MLVYFSMKAQKPALPGLVIVKFFALPGLVIVKFFTILLQCHPISKMAL